MPYGIRDEVWNKLPPDDRAALAATAKGKPPPPIGGYAPPPATRTVRAATPAPPPNLSAGIGSRIEPTGDYPVATPVMTPTRPTVGKQLADGRALASWTLASREAQVGRTATSAGTSKVSPPLSPGPSVKVGAIGFAIARILDHGELVQVRVSVDVYEPTKALLVGTARARVGAGKPTIHPLTTARSSFSILAPLGQEASITTSRIYDEKHLSEPEPKKQEQQEPEKPYEFVTPDGILHVLLPKVDETGAPPTLESDISTEVNRARVRVVRRGNILFIQEVGG